MGNIVRSPRPWRVLPGVYLWPHAETTEGTLAFVVVEITGAVIEPRQKKKCRCKRYPVEVPVLLAPDYRFIGMATVCGRCGRDMLFGRSATHQVLNSPLLVEVIEDDVDPLARERLLSRFNARRA